MNDKLQKQLIQEVRLRPILWDKENEHYNRSRPKCMAEWRKIAKTLKQPVERVKTKWKNLRDMFSKELRRMSSIPCDNPKFPNIPNYSGIWQHFSDMFFLRRVMGSLAYVDKTQEEFQEIDGLPIIDLRENSPGNSLRQSWSYQEFENINPIETEQILITDDIDSGSEQEDSNKRTKKNYSKVMDLQRQILALESERKLESEDEDMLFVKSLVPYLKELNPIQKLRLKGKIQNLIADEMSASIGSQVSNVSRCNSLNSPQNSVQEFHPNGAH